MLKWSVIRRRWSRLLFPTSFPHWFRILNDVYPDPLIVRSIVMTSP